MTNELAKERALSVIEERALAPQPAVHLVPWQTARDLWLKTLNNENTKRSYRRAVDGLCEALGVEYVADIAPGDLTAYRDRMVRRTQDGAADHLAPASVDLQITAMRRFLLFCWVNRATTLGGELVRFCLPGLSSTVQRPYEVPTDEERAAILAAARERGPRAHTLLAVLFGSGVRVAELARLRVGDLRPDGDGDLWLYVRLGKGRKSRKVPLHRETQELLRAWLAETGRALGSVGDRATPLFTGRQTNGRGKALTPRRVRQIFTACVQAARVTDKALSPHSARHDYAIRLLRSGADLITVQKLLGHASVQTTQRYLDHIKDEELKEWALAV